MKLINENEYELSIAAWQKTLKYDAMHSDAVKMINQATKKIKANQKGVEEALRRAEEAALKSTIAAEQVQQNATKVEQNTQRVISEIQAIPKPKKDRFYVILQGDTLESIAEKLYGDSTRWTELYELNKEKITAGMLTPGGVLVLP